MSKVEKPSQVVFILIGKKSEYVHYMFITYPIPDTHHLVQQGKESFHL